MVDGEPAIIMTEGYSKGEKTPITYTLVVIQSDPTDVAALYFFNSKANSDQETKIFTRMLSTFKFTQ